MRLFYFGIFPILLFLCSCSKNKAVTEVIPESTFVKFYVDSLILSEEVKISPTDSTMFSQGLDSLYKKYNLNIEQIEKSYRFYQEDLLRWRDFYSKAIVRLEYLQQENLSQKNEKSVLQKLRND